MAPIASPKPAQGDSAAAASFVSKLARLTGMTVAALDAAIAERGPAIAAAFAGKSKAQPQPGPRPDEAPLSRRVPAKATSVPAKPSAGEVALARAAVIRRSLAEPHNPLASLVRGPDREARIARAALHGAVAEARSAARHRKAR